MGVAHALNSMALQTIANRGGLLQDKNLLALRNRHGMYLL
jgi:hypothetical protein